MSNKRQPLIISHAKCMDGKFAAAVAYDFFEGKCDTQFESYHQFGERFAGFDIDDRDVYLVDISIHPRYLTQEIRERVNRIVILDHHQTHCDAWGFTQDQAIKVNGIDKSVSVVHQDVVSAYHCHDMSGAELAYRYFWGSDDGSSFQRHLPDLIAYISDRDRWVFEFPDSRAVHEWLTLEGLLDTRDVYGLQDALTILKHFSQDWEYRSEKIVIGHNLLNYKGAILQNLAKNFQLVKFMGYTVPLVPCPKMFASEVGEILAQTYPFAIMYYDDLQKGIREYSLRSRSAEVCDVQKLAKRMGGGGHTTAAGFTMRTDDRLSASIMQFLE